MTAPSMTTPLVTNFQKATKSFRAKATIVVFRIRPPLRSTRSKNYRLRAEAGWCRVHSHATWIMVVLRRGLPAFETPCS